MDSKRPFKSDLVLREQLSEVTLRAYHVGFEENKFRLQPLVDIIRSVNPELALGYYAGEKIPLTEMVEKLKEAAETVYTTEKYQRRGEFGELILHLLLRDFCKTIPLVSKIYFKDSHNVTIHGFDGVQVTIEKEEKKLWLGESKLYIDGTKGVKDLAEDLMKHIEADYLRREFVLLSRKLPKNVPDREYWLELMDKHQTLENIYSNIVIPMVCTYSSKIFENHQLETQKYIEEFEEECKKLWKIFNTKSIKTSVDVILMLLPVPNKDELNCELHKRLKAMQNV